MNSDKLFEAAPSQGKPVVKPKKNPSKKRLEGFLKWENETPRLENEQLLGGTLRRLVDYLGVTARLNEQRVIEFWPDIVGEKIAAVTHARSIKFGVLTIEVVNPSWRQELAYMAPEILTKLNRTMGYSLVKRLKFC